MADFVYGPQIDSPCSTQALQAALELSMVNMSSNGLAAMDQQQPYGIFSGCGGNSKSLNITQCVSVPSSEHVAEIVGKQGNDSIELALIPLRVCEDVFRKITVTKNSVFCLCAWPLGKLQPALAS